MYKEPQKPTVLGSVSADPLPRETSITSKITRKKHSLEVTLIPKNLLTSGENSKSL